MSDFKKQNIVIGALCVVLLFMMVGYAVFNTLLTINGTTSNWSVLITNIESRDIVGNAYDVEAPAHTNLEAAFPEVSSWSGSYYLKCSPPDCTPSYTCDEGYTQSGSGANTKCIKTEEISPEQVTTYTCPDGYKLENQKWYK